ncbi:GNAT family N-acetyltransferase [Amphiplicatus metriothermophilus]|uniref:Protein N-acetyltransferase, RimJ/RimL family n=1 Tax=Amphiplicatus metriothermophilus TaxID=1519374 RepID=A0A239PUP8_9PROT|nr:GNAT family N-acetyltransferase [Amphiplicatus metriothermophilus]MBB5519453.1 RimJ/RimL family protein N-acetyltransferase [Amphiplicatus metriothermophilus]SNT73652.1 Protein N-acetyltransferase, RimJ/RimL family [Amphiplicatus metriothermophilus]
MARLEIPLIETERLVLRGRRMEDFPAFAAMWAEEAVVRLIGGKPLTREQAWGKFSRETGDWALLGFGFWLVVEKATGAIVGDVGFSDFKRDIEPPLDGLLEFGWVLAGAAQGKGYATEAARAALNWAEANVPGRRKVCIINETNARSMRVAEKCGFREAWRATYRGEPVIVFERA